MQLGKFIATTIWAAAMACCVDVRASDSGMAKKIHGEVRLERGATSSPLRVGDPVQELDRIVVGANGSAGITLKDETLISLGPNSALVIDGFAFDSKTHQGHVETSILRGAMRYVTGMIGHLSPKSVRVQTPTITIGIRGTEFIVEVADAN